MIDWTDHGAPSVADLTTMARAAFDALPAAIRAAAGDVEFHVEDFADEEVLNDLGIEDPFELSGLYDGVDRIRQSVLDRRQASPESSCSGVPFWTSGPSAATSRSAT